VAKFAAGGVDTGGNFAADVVNTGGTFAAGVIDIGGAPWLANISLNIQKIWNDPSVISEAWGKTIHEKIWSKKSHDKVPLITISHTCLMQLQVSYTQIFITTIFDTEM
jgi:hypothetical protein